MATYRGFTVSFNSIGAGKIVRKYLLLAIPELLAPLLHPANKNMIEAKAQCQMIVNTRAVFRKGAGDTWIKYQLVIVVAPSLARHAQAKRMIENTMPGSVILELYKDTAMTRMQCNEFVPDNKSLVFGFQRNGISHNTFGIIHDLLSPSAPARDKATLRPVFAAWQVTKRERRGIALPTKSYPLQRRLNIMTVLNMLLTGAAREDRNASNRETVADSYGDARSFLTSRSRSAMRPTEAFAVGRQ